MARHDHDAGGDPELLAAKAVLREQVWADLDRPGIARFPRPTNRIPNFVGAEAAARLLAETDEWRGASTVKSNPDSPQWPVRTRALQDGKVVYMAVPRLAEADPFFLLDPEHLADDPRKASSIKGAVRSARTIGVDELEPVDLVVTGCVAVDESGARLGRAVGSATSSSRSPRRPGWSTRARSSSPPCTNVRCSPRAWCRPRATTSTSTSS